MSLTQLDRQTLRQLENEPQEIRNIVQDAVNQCRSELQGHGVKVRFDYAHAALDAAVYRYYVECIKATA